MPIRINDVLINPNTVDTNSQFLISVDVEQFALPFLKLITSDSRPVISSDLRPIMVKNTPI